MFYDLGSRIINSKNLFCLDTYTDNNTPFKTYYVLRGNGHILMDTEDKKSRDELYEKLKADMERYGNHE